MPRLSSVIEMEENIRLVFSHHIIITTTKCRRLQQNAEITHDSSQNPEIAEYSCGRLTSATFNQYIAMSISLCLYGVGLNRCFSTNISLYLRNIARLGHRPSYYGTRIGTRMYSIEWRYFQ